MEKLNNYQRYQQCPYVSRKPSPEDCLNCTRGKCYYDEDKFVANMKKDWDYDKLLQERGFR